VPSKRKISEKRDIVDVFFHASRVFVLGPSLGLGFSNSWGEGTKGQWKQVNKSSLRGSREGHGWQVVVSDGVCLGMPVGCRWVACRTWRPLLWWLWWTRYTVRWLQTRIPLTWEKCPHRKEKMRCLVCVSAYKGPNVPWCLVGPLDGRLVSHGPSHRRACLSGYTDLGMETGLVRALRSRVFLVEHRTFDTSARDERRMWITCRWLNLSVN